MSTVISMTPRAASPLSVEGTVKFYLKDKGYGFVTTPFNKDVMVHANLLRRLGLDDKAMQVNRKVKVLYKERDRGLVATDISFVQ